MTEWRKAAPPPMLVGDRYGNDSSAFYFAGEGFLNCGDDNSLRAMSELSVSFWFLAAEDANNSSAKHIILNKEGEYEFAIQNGTLYYAIDNNSPNWNWQTVVQNLPAGTWQHFAFTYDGSSVQCFLNGVSIYELSASGAIQDHTPNWNELWFGNRPVTDTRFIGTLDEVGVWTTSLSAIEVLGLFENQVPIGGCIDEDACNFSDSALWDNGACEYGCSYCLEGTAWDSELGGCVVANPSDSNFDGCVQLNDLLDLLSAYGDCAAAEWACGDPLEYQGYDYTTVQIGDQCWFAENVRYLPSVSSPDVGSEDDGQPHAFVYGYSGTDISEATGTANYLAYGALYNFAAVIQWQLCPSGWHVPSNGDWASSLDAPNWNGTELRSLTWNGTNQSGFNALPGGFRDAAGFFNESVGADFWTSTEFDASFAERRYLLTTSDALEGSNDPRWKSHAFSVRCIKDDQ